MCAYLLAQGAHRYAHMYWTDTHCHLQSFDDVDDVIARAVAGGVGRMVCVGTDLESSRRAVEVAAAHPEVWATVGLHPHDASRFDAQWDGISELAGAERVVGVGEVGFDFHYRHSPPGDQERAFRAHIALAKQAGRTLVVHTREAWDDTFRVLEEAEETGGLPERTVLHCFTGGPAEAERAVALGAWLSFSGIVTFDGAEEVREAAAAAPLDRVLVETDSPYLAPVPHRGGQNEPAYVVHVGERLAAVRGEPPGEVAAATTANATEVFLLP